MVILFIVKDTAVTMWRRLMDAVDPVLVEATLLLQEAMTISSAIVIASCMRNHVSPILWCLLILLNRILSLQPISFPVEMGTSAPLAMVACFASIQRSLPPYHLDHRLYVI
jgi:hypothetical protein